MTRARTLSGRLGRDNRGATLLEFAFVAPVLVLLLMGLGDILYQEYLQAILNGALQKAGRDSTIQGASNNTAAIDANVMLVVQSVARNATYVSSRKNYDTFTQVAPEPFRDVNGNNTYDVGECFYDVNGNGVWDADPGANGQGGANDVALYTITISYPRLFPMAGLMGWASTGSLSATTLLKNQPFATQVTTTGAWTKGGSTSC